MKPEGGEERHPLDSPHVVQTAMRIAISRASTWLKTLDFHKTSTLYNKANDSTPKKSQIQRT